MLFSFIFLGEVVKAESFVDGSFINGEYVNKVKSGKTYYMTMQFINDSQGRIVYCLEPFVSFKTNQQYVEYEGDLTNYGNLSTEQKRKIELIIYYGYGYGNRRDSKWYVVTQFLIWKVVDPQADIYFTSSLNGKRIEKYNNEINELNDAVYRHDIKPSFVKPYEVNYKDKLVIGEFNNDYEVVESDYEYVRDSGNLIVENLINDGNISLRRISNYYQDNVVIFDSSTSQDLIRPGNVNNPIYEFNVKVNKGDITLDFLDDNSVYTVESSLKDTCYTIDNGEMIVDQICMGEDHFTYKTGDLPYGEYTIKQESVGVGYKKNENVYKVSIDSTNQHPFLTINNLLIRNKIEIVKYECYYSDCIYEKDAKFNIKDKNDNLVGVLTTNEDGYTNIVLGYGSYKIEQKSGKEGYTLASSYNEKIVDEESSHKKDLYNYYIEPVKPTPVPDIPSEIIEVEEIVNPVIDEEIVPPNTGAKVNLYNLVLKLLITLGVILVILRKE